MICIYTDKLIRLYLYETIALVLPKYCQTDVSPILLNTLLDKD